MKKTVLSVLAGLMIVGTATALPTPEDRKKVCEQDPEKVWVEKTNACIPTNPCLSDNIQIVNAYCANLGSFVSKDVMVSVHNKYIEQVLHTRPMTSTYYAKDADSGWYAYKLQDGGYVSIFVMTGKDPFGSGAEWALINAACNAYKQYNAIEGDGLILSGATMVDVVSDDGAFGCPLESSELCDDLTMFLSGLGYGEFKSRWAGHGSGDCILWAL